MEPELGLVWIFDTLPCLVDVSSLFVKPKLQNMTSLSWFSFLILFSDTTNLKNDHGENG